MDDWSSCIDDFILNLSTWYCESDKTCEIGEYFDIKNRACK